MQKNDNREEFKSLQNKLGLTNKALSDSLGVSVSTIEKRRAGKVEIADETILAMKWLFNIQERAMA